MRCTARHQRAAPVDSAAGEVAVAPGTSAVGAQLRPEATGDLIFKEACGATENWSIQGSPSRSKEEGSQAPASLGSDWRLSRRPVLCDRGTRARGRPPASLRAPRRANSTTAGLPKNSVWNQFSSGSIHSTADLYKRLLPWKVGMGARSLSNEIVITYIAPRHGAHLVVLSRSKEEKNQIPVSLGSDRLRFAAFGSAGRL